MRSGWPGTFAGRWPTSTDWIPVRGSATWRRGSSGPTPFLEGPEPGGPGRAAGRPVPAQLPPTVADFIGREDLLAQMDAVVAPHHRRRAATVIALTGPAGVGKTALALRWAHAVRDRFPDGQLHVNLHGYSPAGAQTTLGALGQLLRALGVRPDRVPDDVEEASAVYRTLLADRRTLVVLDNCADSEHVRPLLPGHRGCVTVVTSRDTLSGLVARDGVTRLSVDVLPPGDSSALLTRIVGEERTAAEPAAAHALAQLCGHLPLALRVAATRLADRPARTIREDVDQLREGNRLSDLDIDGDRQASVEAALESSYLALADDTRRLFRLISLVPGADVSPRAAAALAGVAPDRAASALSRLVAVHLIDAVGPDRYAFHDLIRLYAQGRAVAEERDADRVSAVDRLLAFYLDTATAAVSLLYPQMLRLPASAHAAGGGRARSSTTRRPLRPGSTASGRTSSRPCSTPPRRGRVSSPGRWPTRCGATSSPPCTQWTGPPSPAPASPPPSSVVISPVRPPPT